MTRIDLLKIAVVLVLIIGLHLLECTVINTKRLYRARQIAMPVISVLYCLAGAIVLPAFYDKARNLLSRWQFTTNSEVFVLNVILVVVFLIVKGIGCPVLSFIWEKFDLVKKTSIGIYDYNENYNEWFINRKYEGLRKIIRVLGWLGAVAAAVVLMIGWIVGSDSEKYLFCLPCLLMIFIDELWCFLNGLTKFEYDHSVTGEDIEAFKIENYNRIREIYERLFTSPLLSSHTGCEFSMYRGATQLLTDMESSENSADRIISKYFTTYDDSFIWDADSVQAVRSLLHRRSVLFFNPFYRNLEAYLVLPIVNTLLNAKKCLVIAGRNSTSKDAVEWLTELLSNYSHLRSMWRVRELGAYEPECDVGVLSSKQLYNVNILSANRDFFSEADFILLLEPSIMINTGQVGLSIVAREVCRYNDPPVFCICDRFSDGLVDTMSHLLRTEITDVCAMPVPRSIYSGMVWDAAGDFIRQKLFDKQTRFLGNGVELAAVAVKNQVPYVTWRGETKAPLKDIRWIAGQYHSTICRYMNLSTQQDSLYSKIHFVPSLWNARTEDEQFVIVEDEFCNMFSMMRTFLNCGNKQTFVNVLSENYLLRDYMRGNQQMFMSNPNSIPSIVPDYAKTERNTFYKLIILMALRPVSETEVADELKLAGCSTDDLLQKLMDMMSRHTYVAEPVFEVTSVADDSVTSNKKTNYFSISRDLFDRNFADSLKCAYYIVENEKSESEYIDAKLFGHVTQALLPGQYITYDGKYYVAKIISNSSGVVLRRAADMFTERKYYRQIRKYFFENLQNASTVSARTIMDIHIATLCCDFSVKTTGYLEMCSNHDLRSAKVINFEDDPAYENYFRRYRNKNILQIRLPDAEPKVKFTICVLMYETFRSIFPDAWQYLAVLTQKPDEINEMLNYVNYVAEGDIGEEFIYIVEDSDVDLGLLDAVERNLSRVFEIITDFIEWHYEKMHESPRKDPMPPPIEIPTDEEKKRKGFLSRLARSFKRMFGIVDKDDEKEITEKHCEEAEPEKAAEISAAETAEAASEPDPEADPFAEADKAEAEKNADEGTLLKTDAEEAAELDDSYSDDAKKDTPTEESKDTAAADIGFDAEAYKVSIGEDPTIELENDIPFYRDDMTDDLDLQMDRVSKITKSRYQQECYLKFGFDEIDRCLPIDDVRAYFTARGWSDNSLTKARKRTPVETTVIDVSAENQCDFCGMPLNGVCFERLADGRTRCNDCSMTSIDKLDDFVELFRRAEAMLETVYRVNMRVPIEIRVTDARTIARHVGMVFRPSTKVAERALGFAQKKNDQYKIFIENGSPRLAAINTCVHEMTHIWQYLNWKDSVILHIYRQKDSARTKLARDMLYEGMAMWSSIQLLYVMGEPQYARQQEYIARNRNDVYGIGFRLYCDRYGIRDDGETPRFTPFGAFPPIDPEEISNLLS